MVKRSREPVDAGAEAPHLIGDGRAGLFLPLPHALDKGLAAEVVARLAFGRQLVFDDLLGGDAGVIGAALPQRAPARHAAWRISASMIVCWKAWPMCSVPVTLGGGSRMQ